METSQSRREDREGEEGVIGSGASGWTPSLHPEEEDTKKKSGEKLSPQSPWFFLSLAFSLYTFFICRTIPSFTGFSNIIKSKIKNKTYNVPVWKINSCKSCYKAYINNWIQSHPFNWLNPFLKKLAIRALPLLLRVQLRPLLPTLFSIEATNKCSAMQIFCNWAWCQTNWSSICLLLVTAAHFTWWYCVYDE